MAENKAASCQKALVERIARDDSPKGVEEHLRKALEPGESKKEDWIDDYEHAGIKNAFRRQVIDAKREVPECTGMDAKLKYPRFPKPSEIPNGIPKYEIEVTPERRQYHLSQPIELAGNHPEDPAHGLPANKSARRSRTA